MFKDSKYGYICLFYLVHFMSMGVYSPYVNIYYEKLGFNGSQIGSIISIGLVCGMVFAPLFGIISDKTKKYRSVIGLVMLGSALSIFIWSFQKNYFAVMFSSIFLVICRSDIGSLSDSLSVQYCNTNGYDYGVIRSLGSLGYLIGAFIVANVLSALGYNGPYVYVFMSLMIIGAALMVVFPKAKTIHSVEKFNLLSDGKTLFKNSNFIYIIVYMLFTSMIIDVAVGYAGNHLVSTLGQKQSMIGLFSCAMVLPEVFLVMNTSKLFNKYGYKKINILACLSQVIRCLGYALSSNIVLFLVLSTFHGMMVCAACVGNINFMQKVVPNKVLATALSIYGAIYTLGSALFSQMFGSVYEYFGSNMIFMITAILSMIALLMALKTKRFDIMDKQI